MPRPKQPPSLRAMPCLIVIALATPQGCGKTDARLLFHAGAGQRSSLDEVAKVFAARHPGVRVDFNYKGSGYFIADIAFSKTGDLYMPGEEFYLIQAVEKGYIQDYDHQRDIAAYFVTVIITPQGNPKKIGSLQDFARPDVRVGLGDPEACAIGVWHEKTFKRAGIWDEVRRNATMFAKCIPELGNAVQLKAIDASIVWTTTAVLYLKDIEIIPIEPRYRGCIRLPVAVLEFAKHPDLAQKLKAFILSDEGKAIFHSHAYAISVGPLDDDDFCADGGKATAEDMKWLVEAAKVAKDPSVPVSEQTVGHLIKEVSRQRASRR